MALYEESFTSTAALPPPVDERTEAHFSAHIEDMLQRHRDVVPMLAVGIRELKEFLGPAQGMIDACPFLQDFLDNFYFSRMSLRLLMGESVDYAGMR